MLVTGATAGSGWPSRRRARQPVPTFAIWGTNPEKNAAASAALEASGRRVFAAIADVGDEDAVVGAMGATVAALGKVDCCFANAGVGGFMPFLDLTWPSGGGGPA